MLVIKTKNVILFILHKMVLPFRVQIIRLLPSLWRPSGYVSKKLLRFRVAGINGTLLPEFNYFHTDLLVSEVKNKFMGGGEWGGGSGGVVYRFSLTVNQGTLNNL